MAPTHLFKATDLISSKRVNAEAFNELKNWHNSQNFPKLTDEQIALFLLSNYNDLEASKNTIRIYFKVRSNAVELFNNRSIDAEDVQEVIQICDFAFLSVRTVDNYAIVAFRFLDYDYQKFNVVHVIKMLLILVELPLYKNPPDGLIVLLDLQGFGLLHLTKLRVGALRNFFQYLQEGFPCRLKQVHVLNTISFLDKLLMIIKPLMNEELFKLIKFHSPNMDMNKFYDDHLPKNCIPADFGGEQPEVKVLSKQTYNTIRDMETFYKDEEEQVKQFKNKT